MDEMWSFYHDKEHQIWLWWAVEHETNTPLAYVFGTRKYKYLDNAVNFRFFDKRIYKINCKLLDYNNKETITILTLQ